MDRLMNKINPSVKAVTIILCGLLNSFHFSIRWNLVIIGVCALQLLLSRVSPAKVIRLLIPITLAAASVFMALLVHGSGAGGEAGTETVNFMTVSTSISGYHTALAVGLRIYAYAFLGMLFTYTTDYLAFIYSLMQQLHLSPKFAYGVFAAFNLLPVIRREYAQIRLSYQVRGIRIAPWSLRPLFPALVNAMHYAESLAMAMEAKGFDETGERTCRMELHIHWYDCVWALCMTALCLAALLR